MNSKISLKYQNLNIYHEAQIKKIIKIRFPKVDILMLNTITNLQKKKRN